MSRKVRITESAGRGHEIELSQLGKEPQDRVADGCHRMGKSGVGLEGGILSEGDITSIVQTIFDSPIGRTDQYEQLLDGDLIW